MPDDFDSPVSIANEHTRAAMSDGDRNRLAEGLLSVLRVGGVPTSADGVKDLVYALVNGLRVLGAINVGIADLGLEMGALVRTTALAGLVQAQGAADTDAISPSVLEDLQAIAAEDDDAEGGGADPTGSAAVLLEQLDDEGRRALADALVDRTAGHAGLAELLDHFLGDDEDHDAGEDHNE